MIALEARPEPVEIDPARAAVLVIDMQNDFGAPGGMFDRAGIDISGITAAAMATRPVLEAAREAGLPVIYLKMEHAPDLSDMGPTDGPHWIKHRRDRVGESVAAPDGSESRTLVRDTWSTEILEELAPRSGDQIVSKHRYSGFFETELDDLLRRLGIRFLLVTGCTTSICVESTIRDAFFRDYHCMLLEDCTAEPMGASLSRSNHDATILLVERIFGSVSTSSNFIDALHAAAAAPAVGAASV